MGLLELLLLAVGLAMDAFAVSIYALFLFPFAGGASLLPPPAVRIYKDVCFIGYPKLLVG